MFEPIHHSYNRRRVRKRYNPPPLTTMWINFDWSQFFWLCLLSAIIGFQTWGNQIFYMYLNFINVSRSNIKQYHSINMYEVLLWLVQGSPHWKPTRSHCSSRLCLVFSVVAYCSELTQLGGMPSQTGLQHKYTNYKNGLLNPPNYEVPVNFGIEIFINFLDEIQMCWYAFYINMIIIIINQ